MKEEFRRSFKRPLNLLFMVLGILLMAATFFYVHTDKYQTFELKNKSEVSQIDADLLAFQIVNSDEGSGVYQNLLLQKSTLAKQLNSVLFNKPKKYVEASFELTELRLAIREEQDFNESNKVLQPNIIQTMNEHTYYSYLKETKEEVILKPESVGSLTILFLTLLGVIWFPICSFLTANTLEDEYEHTSLVRGAPKTFMKRMLTKFSVLYVMFLVSFLGALITGGLLTQLLGNSVNDLGKVDVIQLLSFSILKKWQIIGVYFIYLSILLLFVFILSVFLNVLVRNFYLTLIIELIIYALTILLPDFISQSPWYIGSFIVPTYLFEGTYLNNQATTLVNPVFGLVYLIGTCIILGTVTAFISSRGLKGVRN